MYQIYTRACCDLPMQSVTLVCGKLGHDAPTET
jgi:hypothetical protein